ncbi:molybdopterin molybdotransferase MoeA [Neisseriaceae bacterium TC5R-5]|nr:molybdopterin molybdotransferase MoeA [Neisseriaceae bacterium TC5R-5]
MLSFDQAHAWLLARANVLADSETLPLLAAAGRVLASPVIAGLDVPPHDNSAMDGYALCTAQQTAAMPVSQRVPAGTVPQPLVSGSVARIFTGAPIPPGADAVLMQEVASVQENGLVGFSQSAQAGQNIRRRGEEIHSGQQILAAGKVLTAADIGLAASVGLQQLTVWRRLRVAVFFTGDELVEPGQSLAAGQIYNSNRYWLLPALASLGCEVQDLGIIADSLAATREALRAAASQADVIMTCGGVSVGEEDHVKAAVEAEGTLDLWKVAMKPGKPLAYGKIGQADFIGLPGNPVSGFITFQVLARAFLQQRAHVPVSSLLPQGHYPADFDWTRPDAKRSEFLRVRRVEQGGVWSLQLYPQQGSGVLMSCAWADGLVCLAPGQTVAKGELLAYLPLVV